MPTSSIEKPSGKLSAFKNATSLTLLFTLIFISIFIIRSCSTKESAFVDDIALQIEQEMADNQIVLSSKGGRRTVAEFMDPIILQHGKDSRLIVYTAHLTETISIADKGLGGWDWTSIYQDVAYEGDAQYTVDLSQLSEEDIVVNYDLKTLTVRIPYAVLSPINIPADLIKFLDEKKGWAAPKDIKMTPEENAQLMIEVTEKMKAKLIDENIIAIANDEAKSVVADLLTTIVHSVDPEYTIVVVQ